MIKVNCWGQLVGVKNDDYRIEFNCAINSLEIFATNNFRVGTISITKNDTNKIAEFLKLFGFYVELIEPPKLTQKEMDAVKGFLALGFERIQRDVMDLKLYLKRKDYLTYILLPSDLFKGLENCQAYDLSEMLSWGGRR